MSIWNVRSYNYQYVELFFFHFNLIGWNIAQEYIFSHFLNFILNQKLSAENETGHISWSNDCQLLVVNFKIGGKFKNVTFYRTKIKLCYLNIHIYWHTFSSYHFPPKTRSLIRWPAGWANQRPDFWREIVCIKKREFRKNHLSVFFYSILIYSILMDRLPIIVFVIP